MGNKTQIIFDKYIKLRDSNSELSSRLFKEHKNYIECRKGCDKCCIDYSIFPVEFYFILNTLRQRKDLGNLKSEMQKKDEKCAFLHGGVCSIYPERPIICRTHGLPLLFANDDGEWELSVCDLNFTDFDFANFTFENTFPQDKFNSKLFLLNKEFIAEYKEKQYNEFDLIPIRNLIEQF